MSMMSEARHGGQEQHPTANAGGEPSALRVVVGTRPTHRPWDLRGMG